jgi:hypothetical protein
MRRALLSFKGLDGRVHTEVLGRLGEFAELVDPEDGSVSHAEPFVMNGAEWVIQDVTITDDFVRISCVPAHAVARVSARHATSY